VSRVLAGKIIVVQLSKFAAITELEGSLLCSQEYATGYYAGTIESSSYYNLFSEDTF
jgi:hypothetical protein